MDSVEKLYKNYDILINVKEKTKDHEEHYLEILNAVKGSTNEKRLASQFIVRFFKYFPSLSEQAIDSVMDLCEDDDVSIRKQAIKDLPHLCRENRVFLPKIADVLAQMLQSEDNSEVKEVHNSLCVLLKLDAQGCLYGLFSQIQSDDSEDNVIRERAIKFLAAKLKSFAKDIVTKDVEQLIWDETKKALECVSSDEFALMMGVLADTALGSGISGHQQLFDMTVSQLTSLDMTASSLVDDAALRNRVAVCTRLAASYASRGVKCDAVLTFTLQSVLPSILLLDSGCQLMLLQPFAELCVHATAEYDQIQQITTAVLHLLVELVPLPPAIEDTSEEKTAVAPSLQFSQIECLLYALHLLARHCPSVLTDDPDTLTDFRQRIQYLARCTQAYTRSVRESLQQPKQSADTKPKSDNDAVTETTTTTTAAVAQDNRSVLQTALKITSNITSIVRDLFHNPPIFKCAVAFSWKQQSTAGTNQSEPRAGDKRRVPITFDKNGTSADNNTNTKSGQHRERGVYQPPSGKYSARAGDYQERRTSTSGSRGRFRGNWRR